MGDILTVEELKQKIAAIDAAIDFLIANPTAEYSIDTGQGVQRVKRHSLKDLWQMRDNYKSLLLEKTRTGRYAEVNRC